jgi:metal-responsive CopG/Arc/MetJ family transcriptional regulator
MKLSVSLPDKEVEFLDKYATEHEESRSATVLRAVRLLREEDLVDQYAAAYQEWEESGEAEVWDAVAGDGLEDDGVDYAAVYADVLTKPVDHRAAG